MKPKKQRRQSAVWRGAMLVLVGTGIVAAITDAPAEIRQALAWVIDEGVPPDSDGDGIPDQVESSGWRTQTGAVYRTDPASSDSDGDGLTDSDEAGALATNTQSHHVYVGYSDPGLPDTDGDGLGDADEADLVLDPFDRDSDQDGLEDGHEVEVVGSAPDITDTDSDGYDDGYEDTHREDQGLDPLWVDVKVSKLTYATDFAKGAGLGDLWREDSLAWLAGNLTSGAASSIPVVGGIVGPALDVRDAVGSAIHGDWVGSGFSALGAVPGGDAVAIPGKVGEFVARNPQLAAGTAKIVATAPAVPDAIKVRAAERIWKKWDDLRDVPDEALLRLQKGRTNLDDLADARKRPSHVAGTPATFLSRSIDGAIFLESLYSAATDGADTQVRLSAEGCTVGCTSEVRIVDILVDGIAHESKVGHVPWSQSVQDQISRDAWLVETGTIDGAHWHFFASSSSNTVGADQRVYDLLNKKGIFYTMHLPAKL